MDHIKATIIHAVDKARREQASYKYWLIFSDREVLYWNMLSEDHQFQVIYLPLITKLFFGKRAWQEFIEEVESVIGDKAIGITVAWVDETRCVR